MVSVVYEAPNSIGEAVRLLKESEIPARVLAGGTDLIIQNNSTEDQSRLIVDVKKIDGMLDAKFSKDGLELGPSMCCAELTAREIDGVLVHSATVLPHNKLKDSIRPSPTGEKKIVI